MKIHFSCKSCGARYSALPEQTGKKGTCKSCGSDIIVPTPETTEFEITDAEKQYLKLAQEYLETSYGETEAKKSAKKLLNKAIEESEKLNLRGVTNLGQLHLEDQEFLAKRFAVGIRREDILATWNRDYVWILIENEIANLLRLPTYQRLVENEGLSSKEAVKALRKTSPYFGDPEQTHEDYQGEDADIYPEFRFRFDRWREKYLTEQLQQLLNSFSSYNAMIRHFIRKGEI